jgi:hypothetical protein
MHLEVQRALAGGTRMRLTKPLLFYFNVKNIFWLVHCIISNEALTNESCWFTRCPATKFRLTSFTAVC